MEVIRLGDENGRIVEFNMHVRVHQKRAASGYGNESGQLQKNLKCVKYLVRTLHVEYGSYSYKFQSPHSHTPAGDWQGG